jgi:hypothetical protein
MVGASDSPDRWYTRLLRAALIVATVLVFASAIVGVLWNEPRPVLVVVAAALVIETSYRASRRRLSGRVAAWNSVLICLAIAAASVGL